MFQTIISLLHEKFRLWQLFSLCLAWFRLLVMNPNTQFAQKIKDKTFSGTWLASTRFLFCFIRFLFVSTSATIKGSQLLKVALWANKDLLPSISGTLQKRHFRPLSIEDSHLICFLRSTNLIVLFGIRYGIPWRVKSLILVFAVLVVGFYGPGIQVLDSLVHQK